MTCCLSRRRFTAGTALLATSATQASTAVSRFPLAAHTSGRYLVDAQGQPFLLHGDSAWSIAVQLTRAQIDTYLDTRQQQGFNAVMFNAIEHEFSSQWPRWRNTEGEVPFRPAGNFGGPIEAYWRLVDHVIHAANTRGMVCVVNPAYLGYGGGSQGWTMELRAESKTDLHHYGAWLATRYRDAGLIWCLGGDYGGEHHPGLLQKQWLIAEGIRTVDPHALITAHGARGQSAYSRWHGFAGLNLNNIYTDGLEHTYAATERARPGPLPFFHIEGRYENDGTPLSVVRRQPYAALLSGACGHFFGNTPAWGFGEPNANGGAGAAAALAHALDSPGARQMQHAQKFFNAHAWWTLAPRTDTHLVTSDLGQGAQRICPAFSADATLALIWTPGVPFTVNLAALAPKTLRSRWFDPVQGVYVPAGNGNGKGKGSYANVGVVEFTPTTEAVLVIDTV